jgi:hypothetical protein
MMGVPEGSFAVFALIVLALPGIVYGGVQRWLRGESAQDRDLPLAFARGVTLAVVLTCIYVLLLGPVATAALSFDEDRITVVDPGLAAAAVLVLYVLLPFLFGVVMQWRYIEWVPVVGVRLIKRPISKHGHTRVPTAWDHAIRENQQVWCKVRRNDGQWVGGWFTAGSSATSYPEPRSVYIANMWAMDADGTFVAAIPGAGVWLAIGDDDLVIWQRPVKKE